MKRNDSARLPGILKTLLVAGLALSSAAAWGQVAIGTNTNGTVAAGTPNTNAGATTLGTTAVPVLTATNGGNGINPIGSTNGVLNALSPIGGPGGPSGAIATPSPNPGDPGMGMASTSHDFTGYGVGLCTFCHTPHKAKSTLLLWNHTLSSNTFQWDVAATTSGTALPGFTGNAYNGPSAKCLSCHDGSVAIGDVGWYNEASHNGTNNLSGNFKITKYGYQVGVGGNLSGNHPVAIPYPLNGAPNVYNGSTTGAQLATADFVANPTANNIRLYSDIGGGAIVGKATPGKTGIECSSCHDPHNKAAKDLYFLRGMRTGSSTADGYLCLQCHQK